MGLRIALGSYVSRSCRLAHNDHELLTEVPTIRLYWIGLYEEEGPKKWQWFFQDDLAPAIGHCAKRFTGERKHAHISPHVALVLTRTNDHTVLWVLFFLDGLIFIFSLSNFLGNLAVLLLVRFFTHDFPIGAQWGVYLGFVVLGHILWYTAGVLVREIPSNDDDPDLLS